MDEAELLKSWALEEGFDFAGVARLEPSASTDILRQWLDRGYQASMSYLARNFEKRVDPRLLFDGCCSVLCVALRYFPLEGDREAAGDLWPGVARYARGRDYHEVMVDRLRRLTVRVDERFPGCLSRAYVDTGPVLEGEIAVAAGLGAIGKNTLLLHPEAGSWILLGELFLSLDLDPDVRVDDLCGTCSLCLDACPTGALLEPYILDSRKCISYWTIEHRGPIPVEIRDGLGEWVFGCDACQDVCPANSERDSASHPELCLPSPRAAVDLADLLAIDRERYVDIFRGSPMKRAKQEGLSRNAALAMGNRQDEEYVEALTGALQHESETVASHAAWALGKIGGERAALALSEHLEPEGRAQVRAEVVQASDRISSRLEGRESKSSSGS